MVGVTISGCDSQSLRQGRKFFIGGHGEFSEKTIVKGTFMQIPSHGGT